MNVMGLEMLASFLKIDPAKFAKIKAAVEAFDPDDAKALIDNVLSRVVAMENKVNAIFDKLEYMEIRQAFGEQAANGGQFMDPNFTQHLNNQLLDPEHRPARLVDDHETIKREGNANDDSGSDDGGTASGDAGSGSDARPN